MKVSISKQSNSLFRLIKSLTKSEKRYFKLYVSAFREQSGLLALYDFIEKQETYNEASVNNFVASQGGHQQLHVIKYSLTRLILKVMRSYYAEKTEENKFIEAFADIVFLQRKGLYKECQQLITRFYKKAQSGEYFVKSLQFLVFQQSLIYVNEKSKTLEKKYDHIYKEIRKTLLLLDNLLLYSKLVNKILIVYLKEGELRNTKKLEEISHFMDNSLLKNPKTALSKSAKNLYYSIYDIYYTLKVDKTNIYIVRKKILELRAYFFKNSSNEHAIRSYLSALSNLLSIQLQLAKKKEFFDTLKIILTLPQSSLAIKRNMIFNYHYHLLIYYYWSGQIVKAQNIIDEYENAYLDIIMAYKDTQSVEINFVISCIYFAAAEYEKAQKYIAQVLDKIKSHVREDIMSIARLVEIIIHIELGNKRFLDSLVESTYVYLNKKKKLLDFEKVILKFTKQYTATINDRALMFLWKNMHIDLKKLKEKNNLEKAAFGYFDIMSWLESKIHKTTYSAFLKKKGDKNVINWIG